MRENPRLIVCSHPLTTAILIVVSSLQCELLLAQNTRLNTSILSAVEAVLLWQHGTYEVLSNGSITTNPTVFEGDGRIQTQNACSAISSNIYYYNQPALYKTWAVAPWRGKQMLRVRFFGPAGLALCLAKRVLINVLLSVHCDVQLGQCALRCKNDCLRRVKYSLNLLLCVQSTARSCRGCTSSRVTRASTCSRPSSSRA